MAAIAESPAPEPRCLGWFCALRDSCAIHAAPAEIVLAGWVQPLPSKTGPNCSHYKEASLPHEP